MLRWLEVGGTVKLWQALALTGALGTGCGAPASVLAPGYGMGVQSDGGVTIEVSGDFTSTRSVAASVSASGRSNSSSLTFSSDTSPFAVSLQFTMPVSLTSGTYQNTTPGVACEVVVNRTATQSLWRARHAIQDQLDSGACRVDLVTVDQPTGDIVPVHGSVHATLMADPTTTATGSESLIMAF